MSYSFNVRAATKVELNAQVAAELGKVVACQPDHAIDQAQAQASAEGLIGLLADDDKSDFSASVSGSLWITSEGLQQARLSVIAGVAKRY